MRTFVDWGPFLAIAILFAALAVRIAGREHRWSWLVVVALVALGLAVFANSALMLNATDS